MKKLDHEERYLLKNFGTSPSRRTILKSLLLAGVGTVAATRFAEVLAAETEAEVSKLTILSQPGILPTLCNEISTPAAKKLAPNLTVEVIDSNNATSYPRMLAQKSRPVISGAMINDYFAQRGIADDMWEKFDPEIMTYRDTVPEVVMTPGGFGIPFLISPYGIMYNPDKVEKPKSWLDLFKPDYEGRVSMWDAYFDAYVMAAVASGKGPNVAEGIKAWAPHKQNIGAWVSSPIVEEDLVHRGEVWLAPHWGAWAELARSQGKNVAFTIPEEGAVQWACHMQLCKGFDKGTSRLTQAYMNTWLSEDFQLAAIKRGFFSPVNKTVVIPESDRQAGIVTVDEAVAKLIRPDFAEIGSQLPKYKALIDRTLKA
ncbi:ABC transporter substrate-binding protein [Rhodoligotrophos ferricapiens]|uniref:ABC transporter substrate-binding protein n=1 Tax=Rhodoligotrophos ferricapiens TaxID=3069264 RepID=UPI00315C9AC1